MHPRLLAYLQLLRLPTVFTAMADVVLGFVLTHPIPQAHFTDEITSALWQRHGAQFVGLLIASCGLYLSGMVFNDVFDRKEDAGERPGRPIPSGRVPTKNAVWLGIGLMMAGVLAAGLVSRGGLYVGLLLVLAILGYDSVLKRTPLGPLAMGSCRFLNILLGSCADSQILSDLLTAPRLPAALGLGIYIVGVTIFAKTEAKISNRWRLGLAQLVINVGIGVLVMLITTFSFESGFGGSEFNQTSFTPVTMGMLLAVAFTINRRALFALQDPKPLNVQTGVKVMLLSHVMLDASLVYWFLNGTGAGNNGTYLALATASLVLPAMFLSRFIPMT